MSRGVVGLPSPLVTPVAQPGFASFPRTRDVSSAVTVTADATPHVLGAWTELISATTVEANWVFVTVSGTQTNATNTAALLDIGFGAAAAEVAKISSLPAGSISPVSTLIPTGLQTYRIPINVPRGTRISARLQATVISDTAVVTVATGSDLSLRSPAIVDTIGAVTASSTGTNMPTSDTYAELISATVRPYRALVMLAAAGGGGLAAETVTYTLGVGASGSEVAVGTMLVTTGTQEAVAMDAGPAFVAGHVPKGSRIACKQSTGRTYRDAIVIGVPYA